MSEEKNEYPPAPGSAIQEHLVRQALGHLRGLVDILGPCEHFDHHGYCQSHFIESPCRVGKAREFLDSVPNAEIQGRKPAPERTV